MYVVSSLWGLSLFSDAFEIFRLKENISLIGKSNNGINIYSWNYKQGVYDQGTYTGVMAQEVPWATVKVGDYLHVDYTKVDVEFNKIA